ncbi:MAG: peptidylprolyl isomerase [Oscillospiraceae bacterium]|nr:peptidylprolyl isomerase [Oscillospiraceae bacterium]
MAVVLSAGLAGCGADKTPISIEIELEKGGIIEAELYPEIAPITVANFTKLIDESFFDGLIFHRVYPGFMIQGGGFMTDMTHKQAEAIKGEFKENGVKNNLKHERGMLSMARTPAKDSASSQFFIMHADNEGLDGEYAAFGKVISGMEYVDEIATTPNDKSERGIAGRPLEDQIIKTIRRK